MVRRTSPWAERCWSIILLVIGINGCLDSRKDRAFRDYAARRALARARLAGHSASASSSCSRSPSRADALDVQTQVNAQRADAEQLVQRAKDTDHPDELNGANG